MIIKSLLLTLFVIVCLTIISEGINEQLKKEAKKQKDVNKDLWSLYQKKQSEVDTLYKILLHIRQELSLLKLKDCPEEEFKNIPFEIIDWINELVAIKNEESK